MPSLRFSVYEIEGFLFVVRIHPFFCVFIPFLGASVNLLLHKPFYYSGIFNIIFILSSQHTKKKGKSLYSSLSLPQADAYFLLSFALVSNKIYTLGSPSVIFSSVIFCFDLTTLTLLFSSFPKFLLSCHCCFLVHLFDCLFLHKYTLSDATN